MKRTASQFQCLECGEHFAGSESFGRHFRRDTAQCQTPDEMRAVGMDYNAAGFWFIDWAPPVDTMSNDAALSLPDFGISFPNGGPGEPA